jgi:hypothetical protein
MSQTAYTTYMPIGFAGMLADSGENDILSCRSEEAGLMPFGVAVTRGVLDWSAIQMVDTNSVPIGVTLHTHQADPLIGIGIPNKGTLNLLKRGRVYVTVEEAVTPASPVFVRFASGAGGTQKGGFRASADSATAVAWTRARYLTTAAAAGLAVLEVNLP